MINLTVTDDDGDSASVTTDKTVETQEAVTLSILSVIGLGVAALTVTFLYGLYVRRKNKKKEKSLAKLTLRLILDCRAYFRCTFFCF
jgi:hypothetical protein